MKEIIPIFIVGVLLLSGIGAVAITEDEEKLYKDNNFVLSKPDPAFNRLCRRDNTATSGTEPSDCQRCYGHSCSTDDFRVWQFRICSLPPGTGGGPISPRAAGTASKAGETSPTESCNQRHWPIDSGGAPGR